LKQLRLDLIYILRWSEVRWSEVRWWEVRGWALMVSKVRASEMNLSLSRPSHIHLNHSFITSFLHYIIASLYH